MAWTAEDPKSHSGGLKQRLKYEGLRKQSLSVLGIHTLRPIDIAWNSVWEYNSEIRKLWNECNKGDAYEKDRVMRQIDDLNRERRQLLADVGEDDCPVKTWDFTGFVEPEKRKPLPPLEPEAVQQTDTVEKSKVVEQPKVVVDRAPTVTTQRAFGMRGNDGSTPNAGNGVPTKDRDFGSSSGAGSQSQFEHAFEALAASKRNEADQPDLASYEASLFKSSTTDATTALTDRVPESERQVESGDDKHNDYDSLFGDSEDEDELEPACTSGQVAEEPKISKIAADASTVAHPVSPEEDVVVEKNNHEILFSDSEGNNQRFPNPMSDFEAAEAFQIPVNAANTPTTKPAAHEKQVVQTNIDGDAPHLSGEIGGMDLETAPSFSQITHESQVDNNGGIDAAYIFPGTPADVQSPEQLVDEAVPSMDAAASQPDLSLPEQMPAVSDYSNFGVGYENDDSLSIEQDEVLRGISAANEGIADLSAFPYNGDEHGENSDQQPKSAHFGSAIDTNMDLGSDGPSKMFGQSVDQGFVVLPNQESEALHDQGLEADPHMAEHPAPEGQADPNVTVVEQVALPPQERQHMQPPDFPPFQESSTVWNPYWDRPSCIEYAAWMQSENMLGVDEALTRDAYEWLKPFLRDGIGLTSEQLYLWSWGSPEFKNDELKKYESEFHAGGQYIVEFPAFYPFGVPPHFEQVATFNGNCVFLILVPKQPAQDETQENPADVVDRTGNDAPSHTVDTPPGASLPALASPAEIVAAGDPVAARASRVSDVEDPSTPKQSAVAKKDQESASSNENVVPDLGSSAPMDEDTFSDVSASPVNNAEPTTPTHGDADRTDENWSRRTFSGSVPPPSTISEPEAGFMQFVASREPTPCSAGPAPVTLDSVQQKHHALNAQLSHAPQSDANTEQPPVQNTQVAGEANDTSDAAPDEEPDEEQATEYYEAAPSSNLGLNTSPKEWCEQSEQRAKDRKRKSPVAPRASRKARKTAQPAPAHQKSPVAPEAPARKTRKRAQPVPAPAASQSSDPPPPAAQMQHPVSSPMPSSGARGSLPNARMSAQMGGDGSQMYPAPPHMQNSQSRAAQQIPQQHFEQIPQQCYQPMPQQGYPPMPQQGYPPMLQQGFQQGAQQMAHQGLQHPMSHPAGFARPPPQQGFWQQQDDDDFAREERLENWIQLMEAKQELLGLRQRRRQQNQQSQMARPQVMSYQPMPGPRTAPYPVNAHPSYQQVPPSDGYPMAMDSNQHWPSMRMPFGLNGQRTHGQGMNDSHNEGANGGHPAQDNMMN
ncbi:hypothetical protein diail_3508 [Diaporthe ilicicola]|nr:hypothetical protein diail_3508 [Diaporthe ilicicola]